MSISFEEREERPAFVQFEMRAQHDKVESLKQGKAIYNDVPWVLVTPPYSRDVYEEKADTWLEKQKINVRNRRIPQKFLDYWLQGYQAWKDGQEAPVNGTDIRNWSVLTPAQIKMLRDAQLFTIEDVANCNDDALGRIGYGGIDLRNKARAYVKGSTDTGALVHENAELKAQVSHLTGSVDTLTAQVQSLSAQLQAYQNNSQVAGPGPAPVTTPQISVDDLLEETPPNGSIVSDTPAPAQDFELEQPTERDILVQQYTEKFGKKPHPQMKDETLKAKLGA